MKKSLISLTLVFSVTVHICLFGQLKSPVIVIHGGAGTIQKGMLSDSLEKVVRGHLQAALDSGYAIMNRGGTAMEGVIAAITILEDAPQFNAGKGAVMNAEGNHELDASIMDGKNLDAGAVAGVTVVKNPILAALAVMEKTPHVMLAGDGADKLAKETGLKTVKNDYFTTPRVKASWEGSRSHAEKSEFSKFGTVGAVALDRDGNIAAGTSTGGMMNKQYNRIGDSPIIGAGTYASNATCGVSCTGHGEYYIRVGVAKEISAQMEFGNKTLQEAVDFTLGERLGKMEAAGGVIALDQDGNVVMDFNTPGMYRGFKKKNEDGVFIYSKD